MPKWVMASNKKWRKESFYHHYYDHLRNTVIRGAEKPVSVSTRANIHIGRHTLETDAPFIIRYKRQMR